MEPSNKKGLPSLKEIIIAFSTFSITQKILITILLLISAIGFFGIVWNLNSRFLVEAAVPGGKITEGVIGTPRLVNPILAVSDADRDLVSLTYSGLLRVNSQGELVPDLAERYEISPDGLTYTFYLRPNLRWHNGDKVTAEDVEFTILKAQDPSLKSPRRASWEGVKVERDGSSVIKFTLKKPYAAFLENAALGILPKTLWKDTSNDSFYLSPLNMNPIGTGPYRVTKVSKNSDGLPTSYELKPFRHFALGMPKLKEIVLKFYLNEEELVGGFNKGEISSMGAIAPVHAEKLKKKGVEVSSVALPRVFAVFFNQNRNLFTSAEARQALNLTAPKEKIVYEALKGYAQIIDGPRPLPMDSKKPANLEERQKQAAELLAARGWKKSEEGIWQKKDKKDAVSLRFSLATVNTPEMKQVAEILKKSWEEFGAEVTIQVYEIGDLDQNIIRPRQFDALLFGQVLSRQSDLYPFWHSSQRLAPGLNVAQYTNADTDKILEEARRTTDSDKRESLYQKFSDRLVKDYPAVFLYSPFYLYVLPPEIKGEKIPALATAADRFTFIHGWYANKEKVWKIFVSPSKTN